MRHCRKCCYHELFRVSCLIWFPLKEGLYFHEFLLRLLTMSSCGFKIYYSVLFITIIILAMQGGLMLIGICNKCFFFFLNTSTSYVPFWSYIIKIAHLKVINITGCTLKDLKSLWCKTNMMIHQLYTPTNWYTR